MLCFVAKTNKEYCMINTLVATMPDGRKYVFDRDTTEYSIEDNGGLFIDWYGICLWEADDIHDVKLAHSNAEGWFSVNGASIAANVIDSEYINR